jgi:hypothetical protein
MKLKVVVELDISQRMVLQRVIGKSKGITPTDYKEALVRIISDHILEKGRSELLKESA